MYYIKNKRNVDVTNGCHVTLSDQQYKMLPENLKSYYKKSESGMDEDETEEEQRLYPDSTTNHNTF